MNEPSVQNGKNLTIPHDKSKLLRAFESGDLPEYLTKEEADTLIAAVPQNKQRDALLLMFLWMTGCRITEALSISKGDVDFYNRTVRIKWLKRRKAMQRILPLHPKLAYSMSVYCGTLNLADKLFPITRQRAFQIVQRYAKLAGVAKKVHPHTLRHSFAVYFLKERKNIVALQKLLGHSQITMTMTYLRIVQSDLAEEVEQLNF